jgi:hypothetical protein
MSKKPTGKSNRYRIEWFDDGHSQHWLVWGDERYCTFTSSGTNPRLIRIVHTKQEAEAILDDLERRKP